MLFWQGLSILVLLHLVYYVSFFALALALRVSHSHYFLGYGRAFGTVRIRGVQFSFGWYIPLVLLARIYTVVEGKKTRMRYPWEFTDRPVWRRLFVSWGGVFGLMLAGWMIFTISAFVNPTSLLTREDLNRYGIDPNGAALKCGFKRGDKIIRVNGKDYTSFSDLVYPTLNPPAGTFYTVERDGKEIEIRMPEDISGDFDSRALYFLRPFEAFCVDSIKPNSPAERADLRPGDRIIKVNDYTAPTLPEMQYAFDQDADGEVLLEIERTEKNTIKILQKTVILNDQKRLGILTASLVRFTRRSRTFSEAIWYGTESTFYFPINNFRALFKVLSNGTYAKQTVNAPLGKPTKTDRFWLQTGAYALGTWTYNLLPLPLSIFWEMIPLLYESVSRKKYPYKFYRWSRIFAWVLFFSLMLFILVMDLSRLFS